MTTKNTENKTTPKICKITIYYRQRQFRRNVFLKYCLYDWWAGNSDRICASNQDLWKVMCLWTCYAMFPSMLTDTSVGRHIRVHFFILGVSELFLMRRRWIRREILACGDHRFPTDFLCEGLVFACILCLHVYHSVPACRIINKGVNLLVNLPATVILEILVS